MKKINLGDIFEIKTAKGYTYLHFIFKNKELGELIRVLPNFYDERPLDFKELEISTERFMVFFPLSFAYKKKIVEKVYFSPYENYKKPDYMRTEHIVGDKFLGWDIVNTNTWDRKLVKKINSKQKSLSPWGIWNDTLLIENLEKGWSLENWG